MSLKVQALRGLHETALAQLLRYVQPGLLVADLGAGSGAFSQRLLSAGYRVVAADRDMAQWGVPDVPLVTVDLDRTFAPPSFQAGRLRLSRHWRSSNTLSHPVRSYENALGSLAAMAT